MTRQAGGAMRERVAAPLMSCQVHPTKLSQRRHDLRDQFLAANSSQKTLWKFPKVPGSHSPFSAAKRANSSGYTDQIPRLRNWIDIRWRWCREATQTDLFDLVEFATTGGRNIDFCKASAGQHDSAAAGDEGLAGHEAGFVAQQKADDRGDLAGLTQTAHWRARLDRRVHLW